MPRIKEIKISPFNEVQDIDESDSLPISRDIRRDIARAVEDDHGCDDRGCDIREALEAGFPMIAAGILSGATECAHVSAVVFAHYFNGTLKEDEDPRRDMYSLPEWEAWSRHFDEHSRECDACGSYSFDTSPGDQCPNCLATLGYNVGEVIDFDRNVNDSDAPYVGVTGKIIKAEWDNETRDESIQWLDIQLVTATVKPHTAPMTGAFWWIVTDENGMILNTPYFDDRGDAQAAADKLNERNEILHQIRSDYL